MIETSRLVLRRWREDDKAPYAALNADPEVRRYFPSVLSRAESDAGAERIDRSFDLHGFGLWAVERKADRVFLGLTGLDAIDDDYPEGLAGGVEIGWRLARHAWGQGYASEAARAALSYGFDWAGLKTIYSFTALGNSRSEAVMRRIGMSRAPELDFGHPRVAEGHPLRPHIVYASRA